MERPMTVAEYLRLPETNRPQELAYGILREPPAPLYGHQAAVARVTVELDRFVRRQNLGVVCVSPIDVVLDRDRALVVQPDVVYVSAERIYIIGERICGAPDLVVEVLSGGTARRDRTTKLGWYREYGVKECWLVDDHAGDVTVMLLQGGGDARARMYRGPQRLYSRVLRGFRPRASRFVQAVPLCPPRLSTG